MKRRKWVSAFLILTLFITLLSCPTLFAQELFGSGDSGTDLEEDFTAGLSDPAAAAGTESETEESVESVFSSDVSVVSGSDPGWTGEKEQAQDSCEESAYVVNPMWADVVTEEELRAMFAALPEEGAADPVGSGDTVSFENPRECVDYIRSALVAHRAYVSCSIHSETKFESPMGDLFSFLLTSAFEHTGNPKEGDSLSGDLIGGWKYIVMDTDVSDGYNYHLVVRFLWATTIEQQRMLDDAVAKVIALMNEKGASSDYEKVCFLYQYVTEHVEYDGYNDPLEGIHSSAYSALVNGRAVGNGFALLVYRLMLEAGIDCRCIRGNHNDESPSDGHAWNIVRLGDVYYNVDASWDDSSYPDYQCFLRCDKNFYGHSRDIEYLTEDYYERYPMSPTDYEMPDAEIVEKDGLIYETRFEAARVTGYVKSQSPVLLTIPSVVNGYTVTEISGDAFCGCDTLQEITLPAALKVIEDGTSDEGGSYTGAFANCPNLKVIHFAGDGSLLKVIGRFAFYNCTGLEEVLLPEGLERIGYQSFAGCSAVKKVVIPASVAYVDYGAFYDMKGDVFIYGADAAANFPRERTFGEKETVIHGYGGSATQGFAKQAGYEFRLLDMEEHTHEWGSPIVYREASCMDTGILHYICRGCGMDREEEIPETDHTFSDWVTIKEPTCSKTGMKERYCVLCRESDWREVKKTKHTYGAWKTIRKATVLRTGKRSKTCSECGYIWTKTDPKLTPTWKLSAEKVTLKKGRVKTSRIITGFASGDYVKSWKSSRPSVVTVEGTKKGKVTLTAKKKGTANITAALASGIKVSFAVNVK